MGLSILLSFSLAPFASFGTSVSLIGTRLFGKMLLHTWMHISSVQNTCWLMIIEDYTNPIGDIIIL